VPNIFKDDKVSISERVTFLCVLPLRLSFAVCRISEGLLISAFKRRFGGLILVYTVSDKFALTGKLVIRTYRPYIQI